MTPLAVFNAKKYNAINEKSLNYLRYTYKNMKYSTAVQNQRIAFILKYWDYMPIDIRKAAIADMSQYIYLPDGQKALEEMKTTSKQANIIKNIAIIKAKYLKMSLRKEQNN